MNEVISSVGVVAFSILVVGILAFALVRHLPYSRSMKGILLEDSTSRETGYISAPDRQDLIGTIGLTTTDLRPSGTAEFGDERIDVVTEGPFLEAGVRVKILNADGYRHVVREVSEDDGDDDDLDAEGASDNA